MMCSWLLGIWLRVKLLGYMGVLSFWYTVTKDIITTCITRSLTDPLIHDKVNIRNIFAFLSNAIWLGRQFSSQLNVVLSSLHLAPHHSSSFSSLSILQCMYMMMMLLSQVKIKEQDYKFRKKNIQKAFLMNQS